MTEAKRFFTEEIQKGYRERIEQETDPDKLLELADELRDLLIEMIPDIIHTQKGARKKAVLRRRFQKLVADRHGI
jgi:hypothetical protein